MTSRWRQVNSDAASSLPFGECVYVIFSDGAPAYVGMTGYLYMRLHKHRKTTKLDFKDPRIAVKYSLNRRLGEHAMREIRLIAKLNPSFNKSHRLSPAQLDEKPWIKAA